MFGNTRKTSLPPHHNFFFSLHIVLNPVTQLLPNQNFSSPMVSDRLFPFTAVVG